MSIRRCNRNGFFSSGVGAGGKSVLVFVLYALCVYVLVEYSTPFARVAAALPNGQVSLDTSVVRYVRIYVRCAV